MNNVLMPARARRLTSPAPYSAATTSVLFSRGARDGSRTRSRCWTPDAAIRRATRPPSRPVDPVTARAGSAMGPETTEPQVADLQRSGQAVHLAANTFFGV